MTSIVTPSQVAQYQRDGFLILENFINKRVCQMLMDRAQQLIAEFNPAATKTIFSTQDERHAKQHYFLESASKVHFFFEEGAVDAKGQLTRDKAYSINKIGHALHELEPVFECFSRQHKIAKLVHDLGVKDPLLVQSMYICKQPHIGGEVKCHQDATFLHTEGAPVMGLWFALEAATQENGCLWAIPGGHRQGLKSRFIRHPDDRSETVVYDASPWPEQQLQALEVPAGSVIVLHGLVPHMSLANTSATSRHAYTLHVTDRDSPMSINNWLKRSPDSFKDFTA